MLPDLLVIRSFSGVRVVAVICLSIPKLGRSLGVSTCRSTRVVDLNKTGGLN